MPKKTRQEKIVAQLKRLQQLQINQVPINIEAKPISKKSSASVKLNLESLEIEKPTVSNAQKNLSLDYRHVKRDLRKSLVFAVVAIIFEVILSQVS